jgi:hypothetical protein
MQSRPGKSVPLHRLSGRQVLFGGAVVLIVFVLIRVFMDWRRPEPAPPTSSSTANHAPVPVIDVMVIGNDSIAVTNLGGWTSEQVGMYLSMLKKARANQALATVGIPAPSTSTGYDKGVVYLIDGHPTADLLGQFVRKEPPGYAIITSSVRGAYRWPPDRLTVGALNELLRE